MVCRSAGGLEALRDRLKQVLAAAISLRRKDSALQAHRAPSDAPLSIYFEHLQDMLATGDFALKNESGEDQATVQVVAGMASSEMASGKNVNNYVRAAGQVGGL